MITFLSVKYERKREAEWRSEKSPQLKLERIAHILILSSCGRKGGGVARAHMAWPIHNKIKIGDNTSQDFYFNLILSKMVWNIYDSKTNFLIKS